MGVPELYRNRIPTFIKHEFLRRYLGTLAHKALSNYREFVFVDGFSGPWKSQAEDFKDTSFVIALEKLREARETWRLLGRDPKIKCVFVEKNVSAYKQLKLATAQYDDVETLLINGRFEENIDRILSYSRKIGQ